MTSIKPSKPESFVGQRDALTVNTWLYQFGTYLNLVQLGNIGIASNDNARVAFASTLLKGIAANWWYLLVQSGQALDQ